MFPYIRTDVFQLTNGKLQLSDSQVMDLFAKDQEIVDETFYHCELFLLSK